MQTLFLKKGEERRIRAGHLWIFSNEVDTKRSPLNSFTPGEQVKVEPFRGSVVGSAYVNPASLITGRVYARKAQALDSTLIATRLEQALQLRNALFDAPYYRLCFGESDGLPGLVIDRHGDVFVVQMTTAGMEQVKDDILRTLDAMFSPRGILVKNDTRSRELEGLESYVEAQGEVPHSIEIVENGVTFMTPLAKGQKTGWFYDMRPMRKAVADLSRDKSVLDVFSYAGGLGLTAAAGGASSVVCIDSSELALEHAMETARINNVEDKVEGLCGDAFDAMNELKAEQRRFDVVSIDPPAFIKRKKDLVPGKKAYLKANQAALGLTADGGYFLSCSCSQHLGADELRRIVNKAAHEAGVRLQIIGRAHQGPDHPVHPAMPETDYLKGLLCRVLRG